MFYVEYLCSVHVEWANSAWWPQRALSDLIGAVTKWETSPVQSP